MSQNSILGAITRCQRHLSKPEGQPLQGDREPSKIFHGHLAWKDILKFMLYLPFLGGINDLTPQEGEAKFVLDEVERLFV